MWRSIFGVVSASWEADRLIESFPLGAHDVSDQLLIPERLYGRENAIELLLKAFERVVSDGLTEFVLVSGYSGVGKSSVVNELRETLVPSPRSLRVRQVRPIQARHPVCDPCPGLPEPRWLRS